MNQSSSKLLRRALAGGALAFVSTFAAPPADAHFILETPASWMSQDFLGNPQKLGPCGDDAPGTPTGEVTTYQQGDTVTIKITETIFHPGHYRVALSVNDRSELPPEPIVTAGSTPCGSVPIQNPPVFPVRADGVLAHSTAFGGPQTLTVKLPPGVTCDKCTLQVIEFMSNHGLNNPGGCFYHHCADIKITGNPMTDAGTGGTGTVTTTTTDTTTTTATNTTTTGAGGTGGNAGSGGNDSELGDASPGGCGCSMPGDGSPAFAGLASLLAISLLLRRRR